MKLMKPTPLTVNGEDKYFLTEDLTIEFLTGTHRILFWVFIVIGPLFVAIPFYYAWLLRHYFKQKTGEKLEDPAKLKEGESLGEELSMLDNKHVKKMFGFFFKSCQFLAL